jgi:hypothetical protein
VFHFIPSDSPVINVIRTALMTKTKLLTSYYEWNFNGHFGGKKENPLYLQNKNVDENTGKEKR